MNDIVFALKKYDFILFGQSKFVIVLQKRSHKQEKTLF